MQYRGYPVKNSIYLKKRQNKKIASHLSVVAMTIITKTRYFEKETSIYPDFPHARMACGTFSAGQVSPA